MSTLEELLVAFTELERQVKSATDARQAESTDSERLSAKLTEAKAAARQLFACGDLVPLAVLANVELDSFDQTVRLINARYASESGSNQVAEDARRISAQPNPVTPEDIFSTKPLTPLCPSLRSKIEQVRLLVERNRRYQVRN